MRLCQLFWRVEQGRTLHIGLQRLKSCFDHSHPKGVIRLLWQPGITNNVLNLHAPDNSAHARGDSDKWHGANHRGGDTRALQLFRYRCAATMAAPSSRHLEYGVYPCLFEFPGNPSAHSHRRADRSPRSYG